MERLGSDSYPACPLANMINDECLSIADFRFILLQLAGSNCDVTTNEYGHNKCLCYKKGRSFVQIIYSCPRNIKDDIPAAVVTSVSIPSIRDIKLSRDSNLH